MEINPKIENEQNKLPLYLYCKYIDWIIKEELRRIKEDY